MNPCIECKERCYPGDPAVSKGGVTTSICYGCNNYEPPSMPSLEPDDHFEYLGDEVYHINGDLQELARRIKGLSHYVKNVNLNTQLLEQKLNQHLETKRQPVRL